MTVEMRNFRASFDLLVQDLKVTLEFIEPVDQNQAVFSHRLYALLLRICTDFESLCREILVSNGCPKKPKDMNIKDYCTLEPQLVLNSVEVDFLEWRPKPRRFKPFEDWSSANWQLPWYTAYNAVKHNRNSEFHKATLNTVTNALAGLFVLLARASEDEWPFVGSSKNGKHDLYLHPFQMYWTDESSQ